ncbi:XRE family transcriptional regulator [Buchananella hordeovulneris]|uniref:helix-turn-helix transcriptional regulator n=1 Tax=Buchananella hordeovulneris TaxID=52770 RepID=UPI000F6024E2|nr:helix-turn-helix transcriptional regulator [Buchananella hordeovulneris]RRD52096.1 XRE family transcriptional regulator [Buchananella hordeovulneris]
MQTQDEAFLSAARERARRLARADRQLKERLIAVRREAGLSQQDVADRLGVSQQAVQKLERYDSDPQLSTLRRYANAVGALVTHTVTTDCGEHMSAVRTTTSSMSTPLAWDVALTASVSVPLDAPRHERDQDMLLSYPSSK